MVDQTTWNGNFVEPETRYYSGADSSRVDNQIMNFAVKNPEFRPLVLLVKHWRNLGRDRFPHIKPITSYHLELLCMKVIRESEFNGLRDLFREFLELVVYSNNRLLVKNPNRYHGALQINGKGNLHDEIGWFFVKQLEGG